MSQQIIQQPDGKYAIWSTVVDDFVVTDATPGEIIYLWAAESLEDIAIRVGKIVSSLREGGTPYHQFTMTFREACELRDRIHAGATPGGPERK